MKNDNSTEQSNASKPMLANRLNAHECYKIKIEKKLTDKEYKNLLIENGIIIKKHYESKSGRGVCKHRGNLYTHGDEVTFDVPTQAVC